MIALWQTDGEPSFLFVFLFIFLLPLWAWVGEQILKSLVTRWKRNR